MSKLTYDDNGRPIQAMQIPITGKTTTLTLTNASTSYATAALAAGLYQVVASADAFICAGATAVATDMPLFANYPMFFHIDGVTVAAISTTAGATVKFTLMP